MSGIIVLLKQNQEILLEFAYFASKEQPEDNLMLAISRAWYNGSYTITAKPIKSLELHYTMIQFLIMADISWPVSQSKLCNCIVRWFFIYYEGCKFCFRRSTQHCGVTCCFVHFKHRGTKHGMLIYAKHWHSQYRELTQISHWPSLYTIDTWYSIQHIVTLPKYGHGAPNIRRP